MRKQLHSINIHIHKANLSKSYKITSMQLVYMVFSTATARDILDHAKARVLLTPALAEENVPRQDIQGVLTILVSVGFPLGLLAWGRFHSAGFVWGLLSLPAAVLISALMFQSVRTVYRWIM